VEDRALSFELLATVFGVIFVAELPDKTALAAVVLATRHRPWPVFLGAALALSVQSVVAVAAGSLVARLDPQYVHLGSGIVFLICAVLMWRRRSDDDDEADAVERGFWRSLWTTFVVIFLAEWGDLTQIGTATLEARYGDWPTVLVGSVAALWCVTALAVIVGSRLARVLSPRVTQRVAAVMFAIVGALLLVNALR
jgi:putative Ca2+/H+ antiporter (TMEM165/GDT1 family)